jgi:hypothetical protein
MGITKGASPVQIIEIIESLVNLGLDINNPEFKHKVITEYNKIFSKTSKDTIIANIRENAMIKFQDDRFIVKLPQDNSKVDLMAVKIINGVVEFRVSQQKGNNASFNTSSLESTLNGLSNFVNEDKIRNYFHLLPENLNPLLNNLPYKVEVIIGMFLACGEGDKGEFKVITNNDYLEYMGILNKDICEIDYWVHSEFKKRGHEYSAIDKCENFDNIYDKCVNIILNYGNQ